MVSKTMCVILVIITLNLLAVLGQDATADSLKAVITKLDDDTSRVNTLNDLSYHLFRSEPEQTIQYGTEAFRLAETLDYLKGQAFALKNIGLGYYMLDNYLEVLDSWESSLTMFEQLQDTVGFANIVNNLGAIYYNQGDDAKALEYYLKSLQISEDIGDKLRIATALQNIGNVYLNKPETQAKGLPYFHQALPIAEELGDQDAIGVISVNLGEIYFKESKYDSAIYYLNKSLDAYGKTIHVAHSLNLIGKVYAALDEFNLALDYQEKAVEISSESGQKLDEAQSLLGLADTYYQQGNKKSALATYQLAQDASRKVNSTYELKDAYQGMATVYGEIGDYQNAYKYHQLFSSTKDTIYSIETDDKVRGLQFTYEIEKKEGQIDLLEKDSEIARLQTKRQKAISIGAGITGFLLLILAVGLYKRYQFVQRTKKIIESEKNRSDNLLLNILPSETAEELKKYGKAKARSYDSVSILFTDFKGFTSIAATMTPEELVQEIHENYRAFDEIITKYNVEKIKTIGDAYMAAGGLPAPNNTHALDVAKAALEIRDYVEELKIRRQQEGKPFFEIRIGIHTGPVVAGIVGIKKFAYDIWGDSVNIASRMESNSEPGKVNISQTTYDLVKNVTICTYRGEIEAKNRGKLKMYFLDHFKETYDILASEIEETSSI